MFTILFRGRIKTTATPPVLLRNIENTTSIYEKPLDKPYSEDIPGRIPLDILLDSEEATKSLGERIGRKLTPGSVVLLYGELGAGKSVLSRGIFVSFGLAEPFPSPTYLYVIEYPGEIAHIDLYMVDDEAFYRLGLEDYFGADYITVVEWADKLPDGYRISGNTIKVELDIIDEKNRRAVINSPFEL